MGHLNAEILCGPCRIRLSRCPCPEIDASPVEDYQGYELCPCGCQIILVWPASSTLAMPYQYRPFVTGGIAMPVLEEEVQCERCMGTVIIYDTGSVTPIRGGVDRWCDSCIERFCEQCDQCDRYFPNADSRVESVNRGRWNTSEMCEDCRADIEIQECDDCGSLTDANNRCHDVAHDSDECGCEDCLESSGVIHPYSYRPHFTFYGEQVRERRNRFGEAFDATPYMGWELEVECARQGSIQEVAGKTQKALGDFIYLKSDSSIDYGFEIVSHPATLDYWMNKFNWSAIRELRKSDITTSNSCGLHVHVARNGFDSPSHEYRWLLFWYRNEKIMKALAHRDADYFAPFSPDHRRGFRDTAVRGSAATGHYAAINCENEYTYEVRIFASTLYVNRLKASLSVVAATVEYTRELRAKKVMDDGGMKWPSFVQWLKPRTAQYPHLMEEIVKIVKPAMLKRTDVTTFIVPGRPGDWRTRQSLISGNYYGNLDTQYRRTDVVTQEAYGLVEEVLADLVNSTPSDVY